MYICNNIDFVRVCMVSWTIKFLEHHSTFALNVDARGFVTKRRYFDERGSVGNSVWWLLLAVLKRRCGSDVGGWRGLILESNLLIHAKEHCRINFDLVVWTPTQKNMYSRPSFAQTWVVVACVTCLSTWYELYGDEIHNTHSFHNLTQVLTLSHLPAPYCSPHPPFFLHPSAPLSNPSRSYVHLKLFCHIKPYGLLQDRKNET